MATGNHTDTGRDTDRDTEAISISIDDEMRALFPLPLVAFEQMMLLDDRDDFPMIAEVMLRFSGSIEKRVLIDSIASAVQRHPMLYCRLTGSVLGGMKWTLCDQQAMVEMLFCAQGCDTDRQQQLQHFRRRIDLKRESGIRFLLSENSDSVELRVVVHHACCDGFGMFLLLEDVLVQYHNRTTDQESKLELPRRNQKQLLKRGKFPVRSDTWISLMKETAFGFTLAKRFGREQPIALQCNPESVSADSPPDEKQQSDSGIVLPVFDDLLKPLRSAAARANVTLNDLLIRDLFLTVSEFDSQHHPDKIRGKNNCIRIMMPCSLRTSDHDGMSAANVMSYSFLSRAEQHLRDPQELLEGVRGETEYIRNTNASLYFIRSLQVARYIPGGMRQVVEAEKCMATALLSNIGDPTRLFSTTFTRERGKIRAGQLLLENILALPPLRPLTRWGAVVCTYGNRLNIGSAFDTSAFTSQDSNHLLARLRRHLEASINA